MTLPLPPTARQIESWRKFIPENTRGLLKRLKWLFENNANTPMTSAQLVNACGGRVESIGSSIRDLRRLHAMNIDFDRKNKLWINVVKGNV